MDSQATPSREAEDLRKKFGWAIEIVRQRFSEGLSQLCDPRFLKRRYRAFQEKNDPIYSELLKGMQDVPLETTFVSYWTIAHTLATQSRFWLENAIADILIHKAKQEGRNGLKVYTFDMLKSGYLERGVTVADLGEGRREQLSSRTPWRVLLQRKALSTVDLIVGEQERERAAEDGKWFEGWQYESAEKDLENLRTIAHSLPGPPSSEVTLQCNLLVIEPDRADKQPHAWGFRFVNRKTLSSHPTRKQERVNLLRLYAYLTQEKILRDPRQIHVYVAELFPRSSRFGARDRYPGYFSPQTYWSSNQLWEFIGVPFNVVTFALRDVAKEFRQQLVKGLRDLLPKPPDSTIKGASR